MAASDLSAAAPATSSASPAPEKPAPPSKAEAPAEARYFLHDRGGLEGAAVRLGVRVSSVVGAFVHVGAVELSLSEVKAAVETFHAAPVR